MNLTKTTIKYSDGSSSEYYKNPQDQAHGPYRTFFSNGQKDYEGSWILNRWVGMLKRYEEDGRRWYVDTRKNNVMNGMMIEFKL